MHDPTTAQILSTLDNQTAIAPHSIDVLDPRPKRRGISYFLYLFSNRQSWLPIASSFALFISAVWMGLSTLPLETMPPQKTTGRYYAQTDISFWKGRQAPVFIFEENLFPHQCGLAKVTTKKSVVLSPYASCGERLDHATTDGTVRLYSASLGLLWSLVPEDRRDVLETQGMAMGQQLVSPLLTLLDSAYFKQTYGVELRLIVQDALRRTWEKPTVQVALAHAIQSMDPVTINRLVNNLWPVALEKTESSLWNGLRQVADTLLMEPKSETAEGSLTGRILEDVLKDPRSQTYLFDTLAQLARRQEVMSFAALCIREISETLIADPRLSALLERAMMDSQWTLIPRETGLNLDFLTQDLPRNLLRYRHPKDHNPLVAYLVRSIVRRYDTFVVLIMTDEQVQLAAAQGIGSGIALTAGHP